MPTTPQAAAFFDVDETLVTGKTSVSVSSSSTWQPAAPGRRTGKPVHTSSGSATGAPLGRTQSRLLPPVRRCPGHGPRRPRHPVVRGAAGAGGFFHPPGTDALAGHLAVGDAAVLVSGSFFASLDPIAAHLGAVAARRHRPGHRAGTLTGEVVEPMIGAAKGRAASAWAAGRGTAWRAASPRRRPRVGPGPAEGGGPSGGGGGRSGTAGAHPAGRRPPPAGTHRGARRRNPRTRPPRLIPPTVPHLVLWGHRPCSTVGHGEAQRGNQKGAGSSGGGGDVPRPGASVELPDGRAPPAFAGRCSRSSSPSAWRGRAGRDLVVGVPL